MDHALPALIPAVFVGLLLQNVFFVAITALWLKRQGSSFKAIGLARPAPRQIGMGLGLGLLLFGFAQLMGKAEVWAFQQLFPAPAFQVMQQWTEQLGAETQFQHLPAPGQMVVFALLGTLVAPVGEEVFFRGLIVNALKKRSNVRFRMVVSALLFAVVHVSPLSVLILFGMGLMLAWAYERTGSLWVPILMHAVNNGLAFLFLASALHF